MLWSAALGLPWSTEYFIGGSGYGSDNREVIVYTLCALFNVVLHAVVRWVTWRRLRPSSI